jgi:hypothetical protein
VDNPNIDITKYNASYDNESDRLYFYFQVMGEMLNGKQVPFINNIVYREPAPLAETDMDRDTIPDSIDPYPRDFDNDGMNDENERYDVDSDGVLDYPKGEDKWLNTTLSFNLPQQYRGKRVSLYIGPAGKIPEVKGFDTAHVFIDVDDDSRTGYTVGSMGIGADYMILVGGKEGKIIERIFKKFSGSSQLSWDWTTLLSNIDAELDHFRMEIGIDGNVMGVEGNFTMYIKTTDWSNTKTDISE